LAILAVDPAALGIAPQFVLQGCYLGGRKRAIEVKV
jgi:hypothetical protein